MVDALTTAILNAFPDVQAIYIYGSAASGEMRPDSDIDLAVLLPPATAITASMIRLLPLRSELERIAKRDVDLINLRAVSTVFQTEILRTGRILYSAAGSARQEFEMLALSYYLKLNEERAEYLLDFKRTGIAIEA